MIVSQNIETLNEEDYQYILKTRNEENGYFYQLEDEIYFKKKMFFMDEFNIKATIHALYQYDIRNVKKDKGISLINKFINWMNLYCYGDNDINIENVYNFRKKITRGSEMIVFYIEGSDIKIITYIKNDLNKYNHHIKNEKKLNKKLRNGVYKK